MSKHEDEDLRTQLRNIVTRNGSAGRIPEILNDELDKLEALYIAHSEQKAVEAEQWNKRARKWRKIAEELELENMKLEAQLQPKEAKH